MSVETIDYNPQIYDDEYIIRSAMLPFEPEMAEAKPSIETFTTQEHRYLSNMYRLENYIETELGLLVPTSEHAYQANRFVDEADHVAVAETTKGVESKNLAHELLEAGQPEKPDWNFIKVGVMYGLVAEKFRRNPDIAAKLIATGDMELVEGNYWQDRYWGVCPIGSRDGQNHLGRILMRVRHELQRDESLANDTEVH